ncbi:ATP-dependent bile acid permease [Trichomonascus vanleenenianus]|uniref:ATP-dependent bile acid permease n=1 Tax=Trichomonascus vanleenenianus TaxID=2268995 RepID=UPI003ECA7E32
MGAGNALCSGPIWLVDDFTACFKQRYLQQDPFAVAAGVSLTVLGVSVYPHLKKLKSQVHSDPAYRPLLADDTAGSADGAEQEGNFVRENRSYGSIYSTPQESDTDVSSKTQSSPESKVVVATVVRSYAERVRVALELVAVACQMGLSFAAIWLPSINGEFLTGSPMTPYILAAFWIYCFLLVLVRFWRINSEEPLIGGLWYHSTTLYPISFVLNCISFRSSRYHPYSAQSQYFYLAQWVLSLVLFTLNFSATSGNKPARIYITDGLRPNNERTSSLFSLITFSFINPLIWKGYWESLNLRDVWDLREDDHAPRVLRHFRQISKSYKLATRLAVNFKKQLSISAIYAILNALTIFGPALLAKFILDYIDDPSGTPQSVAWLYVFGVLFFAFFDSICTSQSLFIGRRICIRMKAILIGEVYAKALRRKAAIASKKDDKELKDDAQSKKSDAKGKEEETPGQAHLGSIINLMAIDAYKVSEICGYLHFFVSSILQILVAIFALYLVLDWSALVGVTGMFCLMPVNYWISKKFASFQSKLMSVTDERVEKTNEVLQAIRIIKYFAWEEKFAQGVSEVRDRELRVLRMRYILWSFGSAVWFGTPVVVTVISFASYTLLQHKTLTSPIAFTALTLFNIMRVPTDQLADMTSNVLQAKVSVDRIEKFLNEPETNKYKQLGKHNIRGPNSPYIGFEKATLSWSDSKDSTDDSFRLRDISVDFPAGQFSVIVGPTGSGKTAMLMGLLGEMDLEEGKIFLPGAEAREDVKIDPSTGFTETVAYCAQQAWLLNDTLRNNILFASEYNEEWYNQVLEACSLKRDLEILEAGDQTEVGEKGIALSGGQKQRISLARAIYSRSRHLLLDDCLSAVDSHTALAIYQNCITGPVTAGRTVILVSHNVALTVGQADKVVCMENGRVRAQGTPQQVIDTGALGSDELIKSSVSQNTSRSSSQIHTPVSSVTNLIDIDKKKSKSLGREVAKRLADMAERRAIDGENGSSESESPAPAPPPPKLIQEERMSRGFVDRKIYTSYITAMGSKWYWIFLVAFLLIQQFANIAQSWWIREWTVNGMNRTQDPTIMSFGIGPTVSYFASSISHMGKVIRASDNEIAAMSEKQAHGTGFYLGMYLFIGLINMVGASAKSWIIYYGSLKASRKLFNELLDSVMRAKCRFFDSTPIGRIMNRFSKDVEGIDQDLAPVSAAVVHCILGAASTALLIAFITPAFLLAAMFIFAIYWAIGVFYLASSRELKRIDAVTKSPIYQHFGESLVGVTTIRAYGDQRRFVRENLTKIDTNNRAFFYLWVTNRWLAFRIDNTGGLVAFTAAASIMLSLGKIDAGWAGLSLSYALTFNDLVLWIVRLYADVEMNMNSVERVREYSTLESEAPPVIENSRPPPNWPSQGQITFDKLSLRYAPELPLVINQISFEVPAFNKVGVVGRTGAGKSTIITALFRFLEADSGRITIDGLDISTIGLKDLRKALAIIPQDPTLFTGTIRSNLDPFDEYTDRQMFEALRRVHLISEIPSSETTPPSAVSGTSSSTMIAENMNQFVNLSSPVTEGGGNLSQGQRQLMCLARSLLKSPKVLLLDEATASIDYETDAKIQKTIRQEFKHTTLLTVAHRLRSIIDYDKILVLGDGAAKEYDHPHVLLERKDSIFREMCERSGELAALEILAKNAYDKR